MSAATNKTIATWLGVVAAIVLLAAVFLPA